MGRRGWSLQAYWFQSAAMTRMKMEDGEAGTVPLGALQGIPNQSLRFCTSPQNNRDFSPLLLLSPPLCFAFSSLPSPILLISSPLCFAFSSLPSPILLLSHPLRYSSSFLPLHHDVKNFLFNISFVYSYICVA
jgi:hypothetical protein